MRTLILLAALAVLMGACTFQELSDTPAALPNRDQMLVAGPDGIDYENIPAGVSGALPTGSAVQSSIRYNDDTGLWEAFSPEDDWYFALTASSDAMPAIAGAIADMLDNGGNRSVRGSNITHYNPTAGQAVITRWNIPYYPIHGALNSWTGDTFGNSAAAAAHFGGEHAYSWLLMPADVSGRIVQNRYWTIEATPGGSSEPAGTITNTPSYTRTTSNLYINGVEYYASRAHIIWATDSTVRNFTLRFQDIVDASEVEWR